MYDKGNYMIFGRKHTYLNSEHTQWTPTHIVFQRSINGLWTDTIISCRQENTPVSLPFTLSSKCSFLYLYRLILFLVAVFLFVSALASLMACKYILFRDPKSEIRIPNWVFAFNKERCRVSRTSTVYTASVCLRVYVVSLYSGHNFAATFFCVWAIDKMINV